MEPEYLQMWIKNLYLGFFFTYWDFLGEWKKRKTRVVLPHLTIHMCFHWVNYLIMLIILRGEMNLEGVVMFYWTRTVIFLIKALILYNIKREASGCTGLFELTQLKALK